MSRFCSRSFNSSALFDKANTPIYNQTRVHSSLRACPWFHYIPQLVYFLLLNTSTGNYVIVKAKEGDADEDKTNVDILYPAYFDMILWEVWLVTSHLKNRCWLPYALNFFLHPSVYMAFKKMVGKTCRICLTRIIETCWGTLIRINTGALLEFLWLFSAFATICNTCSNLRLLY